MNNRYLYKAKRKDNGEWVEGIPIKTHIGLFICFEENPHYCSQYGYMEIDEIIIVDENTLCQCTGLTDKNGKLIWENDIVKAIYKPKDEDLTIDNFIIKWDKYYCKYVGYYAQKEKVYNPLLFGSQTSFEVIGNIFDNPSLLEGGEN